MAERKTGRRVRSCMRYAASSARPAIAAIAAVLALANLPASAQTAVPASPETDPPAPIAPAVAPPVIAPTVAAQPSAASPQVVFKPSAPIVQPTPPVSAPVAISDSATESSAIRKKVAQSAPRSAERTTTSLSQSSSPPAAVSPATAIPAETSTPEAPQASENISTAPVLPPVPASIPARADDGTETGYWILGFGTVLLLGAGAYAALRRRAVPPAEQRVENSTYTAADVQSHPEAVVASPVIVPVLEDPQEAPISRRVTSNLSQPCGDKATRRGVMIAAQPSAENPFLTRKNRLRRANFLLAQEGAGLDQGQVPADTARPSTPSVQPIQVSYGFGRGALRPPVLKPQYN